MRSGLFFCTMTLRRIVLAVGLLLLYMECAHAATEQGAAPKGPARLAYSVLGITLDSSPQEIRKTLKARGYIASTDDMFPFTILHFRSQERESLMDTILVRTCSATRKVMDLEISAANGELLLQEARQRFGLSGLDRVTKDGKVEVGRMRPGETFSKTYANVRVHFYYALEPDPVRLVLENPGVEALCTQEARAQRYQEAELAKFIRKATENADMHNAFAPPPNAGAPAP